MSALGRHLGIDIKRCMPTVFVLWHQICHIADTPMKLSSSPYMHRLVPQRRPASAQLHAAGTLRFVVETSAFDYKSY